MTRKNLFDTSLDISSFLLPITKEEIFGNSNKCGLEIGFGEGEFIAEVAKLNADWNFVGIEIKYFRFKKALRLIRKENLNNVKLIHIDADIAIEQVFAPHSFDRVYINFPDPWPKDRHKKHRIINNTFLNNLYEVMNEESIMEFTSDHLDYVEHTIEHFSSYKMFKNVYGKRGYADKVKDRPATRFEKDYKKENRKIYYLAYKKVC